MWMDFLMFFYLRFLRHIFLVKIWSIIVFFAMESLLKSKSIHHNCRWWRFWIPRNAAEMFYSRIRIEFCERKAWQFHLIPPSINLCCVESSISLGSLCTRQTGRQAGRHTSQSTVPYWSATAFYLSSIITNNHFRKKWLWTIDWKRNHFIEDIKRRENNMQVGTLLKRMNQSSIAVKCTESKSLTANRANENNSQKLNE